MVLISFFLIFTLSSSVSLASDEIQRIVSLLDYISGDYSSAVQSGKIVNEAEYSEMLEFSSALLALSENSIKEKRFLDDFIKLENEIKTKSGSSDVRGFAGRLKNELIIFYSVRSFPSESPNLQSGKILYESNCSSCHGFSGAGNGKLSKNLEPPPIDFTSKNTKLVLSPFKVYNTTTFGIKGTAMPSFETLSEKERWDTAFYVTSLGYEKSEIAVDHEKIPSELKDYKKLATLTDRELIGRFQNQDPDIPKAVEYLRNEYLLKENESAVPDPIKFSTEKIERSFDLYKKGRNDEASRESVDAYLEGFEKAESGLMTGKSSLAAEIEKGFSSFRSAIKSEMDISELETIKTRLIHDLEEAQNSIADNSRVSSYVTFISSFSIIIREALEAVLIIGAIIAFLHASGSAHVVKYIHMGWIAAILCGIATLFLATKVISISGAQRDLIEGVTSLAAAVILFYISYWLLSKIEVNKWKNYLKDKLQNALDKKSVITLLSVSFLAVYREAFETVLFYQALVYQSDSSVSQIVWGFTAGALLITALMAAVHKLALRIPLKHFFPFTSLFLYLLCYIMVGRGIKELQEADYVGQTRLELLPYIDALGIYPTYETAIPQVVVLSAFIIAVGWIAYVTKFRKESAV